MVRGREAGCDTRARVDVRARAARIRPQHHAGASMDREQAFRAARAAGDWVAEQRAFDRANGDACYVAKLAIGREGSILGDVLARLDSLAFRVEILEERKKDAD